ncbi:arginine/serine-rich protein 1 isoform X4 [Sceloporus undulatus]|nr:arginine/serine-rich protein 1 isoform X4 [Sceloporus undulatus]XP_042296531.1 arginine/serine-rich protein 1 isoform X4 [Sceloporus undulatus]XP_042296532.1 arginine/serine-rich protein 1 isoform X4 [Sceloporus undulatus]
MTDFMDDLTLTSPEERSRSSSRSSCSGRSSSRSSSRSSCSSRSSSSTSSSSRSWSRSSSRSRSRPKRNCSRRNRRYSRSYSRSRSRSLSYRYRERYHPRYCSRRYRRSPPRYRSRSRSPRRSYYRRSYSRSRSRSRRYYGFGRTIYPEAYRSWRSRSRSRSRSRTPLRLTEKEKRELLEIAKANAAKTFGTDIALPASLKIATKSNEIENGKPKDSMGTEKTVAKSATLKPANVPFKETAGSPGREEKKQSPSGQWIPVKNEEKVLFHNFSPKSTSFRAR